VTSVATGPLSEACVTYRLLLTASRLAMCLALPVRAAPADRSIIQRYVNHRFNPAYNTTVGAGKWDAARTRTDVDNV
jgi:hypothetical protein